MIFAAADRELFQRLARIGKTPNVVYDIGASNGWWSANVSDGLPPGMYHLFEPLSAHEGYRESLNDHLKKNPTWRLHSVALGDRNGNVRMSIGYSPYDSTTVDMSWYTPGFGSQIDVPQYRLDDYVEEHRLPQPDVVKMDTQASEHLILRGGKRTVSAADILVVETWLHRGYGASTPLLGDIIEIAESFGFALFEFGDHYRDPDGKLQSIDAVFAKKEIALLLTA